MSDIEKLGELLNKGKKAEHPVSESQRRWAFAAEDRGELPEGTGKKWSRRVKGEDLPMKASAGRGVARGGKYYKRVAKPGGGYKYYYTKEEYEGRRGAKPEAQLGLQFGAPEKPAPKPVQPQERVSVSKPSPKKEIPELHESELRIVRGAIKAGAGAGILGRPDDKAMMKDLVKRGLIRKMKRESSVLKMDLYEVTPLGHAAVETHQMKQAQRGKEPEKKIEGGKKHSRKELYILEGAHKNYNGTYRVSGYQYDAVRSLKGKGLIEKDPSGTFNLIRLTSEGIKEARAIAEKKPKTKQVPSVPRGEQVMLSIMHNAHSEGGETASAHFGDPDEKKRVKALVKKGYATIVKTEKVGKRTDLYAKLTPEGKKLIEQLEYWNPETEKSEESNMSGIEQLGELLHKAGARGGKYKFRKFVNGKWQYEYADRGPKNPKQAKEHAKYEEAQEGHDPHKVMNLELHSENAIKPHTSFNPNQRLSSQDLHSVQLHNQRDSIHKNLINKMASGQYDHHEARKLWQYHADGVAKHHDTEFGEKTSLHDRRQLAHNMAEGFLDDHDSGEYDRHLHKKYKVKKSEESMTEPLQKPDPNSMSKGMYSFYNQENAKEIPEMYLMDLVHAFIEEAFEHESKECSTNEMNLEGQDRYAQVATGVYNELVQCAQFNPNLRRALEKYSGVLNEAYVRNYMESQGMIFTRNENYTADKMSQVAGYHPSRMAMSEYSPGNGSSLLEKSVEPMIELVDDDEDPMQNLHRYHQGLSKALRHEHLQSEERVSPLKDTDPHIVDPNKA